MATLYTDPFTRYFTYTSAIKSLVGGTLTFTEAGTSTPKDVYSDSTGDTILGSNGVVTLDATGSEQIWLGSGAYKVVLKDGDGIVVDTADNIVGTNIDASVSSIAELRALEAGGSDYVTVYGFEVASDGGQGTFYWDENSNDADDGGIVIVPNSSPAQGRWIRIYTGAIMPEWFAGSEWDEDALNSAVAAVSSGGTIKLSPGTFTSSTSTPTDGSVNIEITSINDISIIGSGIGSTTLVGYGFLFTSCDNINFQNISMERCKLGMRFYDCKNVLINNNAFKCLTDVGASENVRIIEMWQCYDVICNGNIFEEFKYSFLLHSGTNDFPDICERVVVSNNIFRNVVRDLSFPVCVYWTGGKNIAITGNYMEYVGSLNRGYGVYQGDKLLTSAEGVSITGNTFRNMDLADIRINGGQNYSITGNTSLETGIFCEIDAGAEDATENYVTNNVTISGNSVEGYIFIVRDAHDISITGNTINNGSRGIRVIGGAKVSSTGDVVSGSPIITNIGASNYRTGEDVTVSAGFSSSVVTIVSIDITGGTMTVDENATATLTGIDVDSVNLRANKNLVISGNVINNITDNGITLQYAKNVIVTDNVITDCNTDDNASGSGEGNSGIQVISSLSENIICENNMIRNVENGHIKHALNFPNATGEVKQFYRNNIFHKIESTPIRNGYTTTPTEGTWQQGETVHNSDFDDGDVSDWICSQKGTFGTATESSCDSTSGSAIITGVSDTSDFENGDFVSVSVGFPGSGPYVILDKTDSTLTINVNSDSTESTVTVAHIDPEFTAHYPLPYASGQATVNGDLRATKLGVGCDPTEEIHVQAVSGNPTVKIEGSDTVGLLLSDMDRASADDKILQIIGQWNGSGVASMIVRAGSDDTNKDDGYIEFETVSGGVTGIALTARQDYGVELNNVKSGATKAAAGADDDEIWRTSGHATLPDGVLMIGI